MYPRRFLCEEARIEATSSKKELRETGEKTIRVYGNFDSHAFYFYIFLRDFPEWSRYIFEMIEMVQKLMYPQTNWTDR